MKKITGAVGLALLALFMRAGFLNSDTAVSAGAQLLALGITGKLPVAGAALLARSRFAEKSRADRCAEQRSITLRSPREKPELPLERLLRELRDGPRLDARMRITTAIAQAYHHMGLPSPEWLYSQR